MISSSKIHFSIGKIIFLLFLAIDVFSQSIEDGIIKCIDMNFDLVGLDRKEVFKEIESDLIKNEIITNDINSYIVQLKYISDSCVIKNPRTYQNVRFENIGIRTFKYCTELIQCKSDSIINIPILNLMRHLEIKQYEFYNEIDVCFLFKLISSSILKNWDNTYKNSELWKMYLLSYLYYFSETEEMKGFFNFNFRLPPYELISNGDTLGFKSILINNINEIYLESKLIDIDDLCNFLNPIIYQNLPIKLKNTKATQYNSYLVLYNSIKECYHKIWDENALEKFDKFFYELSETEKKKIMEINPIKLYESK